MKIAVVGGGIFGATAALYAARAGHEVCLFEERSDLLQAASGINQYRLHRGYHYPRSPETALSAILGEVTFRAEYAPAIIDEGRHWYAIAREGSKVSVEECLAFFRAHALAFEEIQAPSEVCDPEKIAKVVAVLEAWIDPHALRTLAKQKLAEAGVKIFLNTKATRTSLETFERRIIATYASLNDVLPESVSPQEYQFEVCEKPVVALPDSFSDLGLVVIDGPFMCADPYGRTGYHVLGNVVQAIHATNTGFSPVIPEGMAPLLNAGIIENPPITKFDEFIRHGSEFIPALKKAKHIGSLYTVRTVLPRLDATDARPTLVSRLDETTVRIFSGKIVNCVDAALEAVALIATP